MEYGQGRCLNKNSLSTARECRMNLGAPSSETFRKLQSIYTCESGVPKPLSLSHCKLSENSCDAKVKPLVLTDNLKVYPVAFENNGTELKPSIQFDERAKVNKGLEDQTRLEYVKGNPYLSKKELEHGIATVALVLSITALPIISKPRSARPDSSVESLQQKSNKIYIKYWIHTSYNFSRNCTIYNFQSSQHLSKYCKYMHWTSWLSFFSNA